MGVVRLLYAGILNEMCSNSTKFKNNNIAWLNICIVYNIMYT